MAAWLLLVEETNSRLSEHASRVSEKCFEFMLSRTLENTLLASMASIKLISDL